MPHTMTASQIVTIYGEQIYTSNKNEININIYADIQECNLLSFAVKVTYDTNNLDITDASSNEEVWHFGAGGEKYSYHPPDRQDGSIVIIGGKIDTESPLAGITGKRVLLGKILFSRKSSYNSIIYLSTPYGSRYSDFVTTEKIKLKFNENIFFDHIVISNDD